MTPLLERIRTNLDETKRRISRAAEKAGRNAQEISLVAVTKSVGIDEARALIELGQTNLGENRVELAREKIKAIGSAAKWHMIGNIQRRKARDVVDLFNRVDAVDRMSLAKTLNEHCEAQGKTMEILIEVNVSGEASKHGFAPADVPRTLEQIAEFDRLEVRGLMTMAPAYDDPEQTRPLFAQLRELGVASNLRVLSMGMSNDFEVAIEEGATEVRIGTVLFN